MLKRTLCYLTLFEYVETKAGGFGYEAEDNNDVRLFLG